MTEGEKKQIQDMRDSWAFSKYVDSFAIKEYTSMMQDYKLDDGKDSEKFDVVSMKRFDASENYRDINAISFSQSILSTARNQQKNPNPSLLFNNYKISCVRN